MLPRVGGTAWRPPMYPTFTRNLAAPRQLFPVVSRSRQELTLTGLRVRNPSPSRTAWSDAVRHRFVNELFAGGVPDAVMARYLIQDHRSSIVS